MTLYLNEMLKLRTVRSTYYLLLIAQAIIVVGVSGAFASGNAPDDVVVVRGVAHVGLTSLFALVLGVLSMAGEYRHRTITDTFLSSPRRGSVVAAKLGVASTLGVLFGIAGSFTALASSWIWAVLKDIPFTWSSAPLWQTLAGAVVWNALFAAIGRTRYAEAPNATIPPSASAPAARAAREVSPLMTRRPSLATLHVAIISRT